MQLCCLWNCSVTWRCVHCGIASLIDIVDSWCVLIIDKRCRILCHHCREEEAAEAEAEAAAGEDAETSDDDVVHEVAQAIRTKKAMVIARSRRAKGSNHPRTNRAAFGVSGEHFSRSYISAESLSKCFCGAALRCESATRLC